METSNGSAGRFLSKLSTNLHFQKKQHKNISIGNSRNQGGQKTCWIKWVSNTNHLVYIGRFSHVFSQHLYTHVSSTSCGRPVHLRLLPTCWATYRNRRQIFRFRILLTSKLLDKDFLLLKGLQLRIYTQTEECMFVYVLFYEFPSNNLETTQSTHEHLFQWTAISSFWQNFAFFTNTIWPRLSYTAALRFVFPAAPVLPKQPPTKRWIPIHHFIVFNRM